MKLFNQLNYTLITVKFRFKTTKYHESPVFLTGNCIYSFMEGSIRRHFTCFHSNIYHFYVSYGFFTFEEFIFNTKPKRKASDFNRQMPFSFIQPFHHSTPAGVDTFGNSVPTRSSIRRDFPAPQFHHDPIPIFDRRL